MRGDLTAIIFPKLIRWPLTQCPRRTPWHRGAMLSHTMPFNVRLAAAALLLSSCPLPAAQNQPSSPNVLDSFVRGDETFGLRLLQQVHSGAPEKNVVLAAISLTILFAAIQDNVFRREARKELGDAFGWGMSPELRIPSRMLLAAFDESWGDEPRVGKPAVPLAPGRQPDGLWVTNRLLYTSPSNGREIL